jgi:hypothetical protein
VSEFDYQAEFVKSCMPHLHIHAAWHKLSIAHAGVNGNCVLVRDFPVRSSHLEVTGIIGTPDGSTPSHSGKTGSVIVNISHRNGEQVQIIPRISTLITFNKHHRWKVHSRI